MIPLRMYVSTLLVLLLEYQNTSNRRDPGCGPAGAGVDAGTGTPGRRTRASPRPLISPHWQAVRRDSPSQARDCRTRRDFAHRKTAPPPRG
eukprot:739148-Rhodomonas_salina.1